MSSIPSTLPRIGALVPAGNVTFEPDLWRTFIGRATVHSHRVTSMKAYPAECAEAMWEVNACAVEAMSVIARVQPDVVSYGFTTASFFDGRAGAEALRDRMAALVPCPVVLPSLAILQALALLKAQRLSVVTPYPAWNNEVLTSFLEHCGFELLNLAGDDRVDCNSIPLWSQAPDAAARRVLEHARVQADVVLLPCTAWRTFEVATELQQRLGIPVVTANQATSWAIGREVGLSDAHPWI